jgi:predicted DNA-binding transcriptional regulator AlpA
MTIPLKTPQAADKLGVSVSRLYSMLRARKFPRPSLDFSGHFVWRPADLAAARRTLGVDRRRSKQPA